MMFLSRTLFSLVMALLLLDVAIGGVVPLGAQQPQGSPWQSPGSPGGMFPAPLGAQQPQVSPWQPAGPGMFPNGFGVLVPLPGAPLQPTPFQLAPGIPPGLGLPGQAARPVVRQCAAEASWQRAPVAPQPLPATPPPQEVARLPQSSPQDIERSSQQLLSHLRQVRTQEVESSQDKGVTASPSQREPDGSRLQGQTQPQGQMGAGGVSSPFFQEPLSPVELSFGDLRQFGYSVFSFPVSTFAPVDDVPVGPDYVLATAWSSTCRE